MASSTSPAWGHGGHGQGQVGSVAALWRYPVKSMLGEEISSAVVTAGGVLGDRAYAVVDAADGKVASAKNPRKWPTLFEFRAALVEGSRAGEWVPGVRITLPDGSTITSQEGSVAQTLSRALGREVTLDLAGQYGQATSGAAPLQQELLAVEAYWPDLEELDYRDTVTEFELPEGTFFDLGPIHVLTTATLNRLGDLYPEGRFEIARFRPNIVIQTSGDTRDFVENAWIGHTLALGDEVRLRVIRPCGRCVMTTLPQGDLPRDNAILRAVARHNDAKVGVYAVVLRGGTIRSGDVATLE